jgi:hypothetical protein
MVMIRNSLELLKDTLLICFPTFVNLALEAKRIYTVR